MTRTRLFRATAWGVGLLALLVARLTYESRSEFVTGESAARQKKWEEAIVHLDRSAHAYFPGNPYVGRSLENMMGIAERFETVNPRLALRAYDSVRGSIYSIRGLFHPHGTRLEGVNERIAQLRAREEVAMNPSLNLESAVAFHRTALARNLDPHLGWALALEIGFLGWIASTLAWIWKGFDSTGRMNRRASLPWILLGLVFFALWMIGMVRA